MTTNWGLQHASVLTRRALQIARDEGLYALLVRASSVIRSRLGRGSLAARDRAHIPTMLHRAELDFLYRYAARTYRGTGAIVDLGCWLGGSSVPLAQGLRDNNRPAARKRVVDAYDSFKWSPWMAQEYRSTSLGRLSIDSSFLPEFEKNVAHWRDRLRTHQGDLVESRWSGGPIEFLFIDAMKSWALANAIIREFYPALLPGVSLAVHQDFVHWNTPWILLLTYRFRNWLVPAHRILDTSSFVFRCASRPAPEVCCRTYSFRDFSDTEADEAFDYCRQFVPPSCQANLVAARITYQIYRGRLDLARSQLSDAMAQGWAPESELRHVAPRLRQVEALRRLVQSPSPVSAAEIVGSGVLSEPEASQALSELAAFDFVSSVNGGDSGYVATGRGLEWIANCFDWTEQGIH